MSPSSAVAAGQPGSPAPRRRRRWWPRLTLAVLALAVGGELAAAAGWWWLTGSCFTYGRAAAARAAVLGAPLGDRRETAAADAARAVHLGSVLHPFLGYVGDPSSNAVRLGGTLLPQVNQHGFLDDLPALRQRTPDRYVVALTGGSVALQLSLLAGDVLAAELAKCRRLAGRKVEIVHLGLGGFKQPQQLFTISYLAMLGGEFDCVINLDGFNEVALCFENFHSGVPVFYPRSWSHLIDFAPAREQQLRLGKLALLREERMAAATTADGCRWSALLQLLWLVRDRRLEATMAALTAEIERAATVPSPALTGPGLDGMTLPQTWAQMAAIWQRCSLQLHAVSAAIGADYFHFLQPNQYVPGSKPMGAEELALAFTADHAYRKGVLGGYPLLRSAGERLRQQGVEFTDLTNVLRDHPEPLYVDDCCHLDRQGYEIVAHRIAATIRRKLDAVGLEFVRLQVEPAQVQLSSPLQRQVLRIAGFTADGSMHDIGDPEFGTQLVPADPTAVDVGAALDLRARRRGRSSLLVRNGRHEVQVGVAADWPDVVTADDGRAAADGGVPRLGLVQPLVAGATVAAVQCTGLPTGGQRMLAVSLQPIAAAMPESRNDLFGVQLLPLSTAGTSATADLPLPPLAMVHEMPLFARVVVLGADVTLAAASNTLVLTRR